MRKIAAVVLLIVVCTAGVAEADISGQKFVRLSYAEKIAFTEGVLGLMQTFGIRCPDLTYGTIISSTEALLWKKPADMEGTSASQAVFVALAGLGCARAQS
jgi:hypothetical protein